MSPISKPIADVIQARASQTKQEVGFAVAKKQLDTVKQTGDAINQLTAQAIEIQRGTQANPKFDARV